MLPIDDASNDWTDAGEIAEALRRLPTPATPEGLEARLIAAIPRQVEQASLPPVDSGRSFRHWITWMSAAAAILALAAIILWQAYEADNLPKAGNADEPPNRERVNVVVTKETDPCNILPPIPDWL